MENQLSWHALKYDVQSFVREKPKQELDQEFSISGLAPRLGIAGVNHSRHADHRDCKTIDIFWRTAQLAPIHNFLALHEARCRRSPQ